MKCKYFELKIEEFIDDALSEKEAKDIEQHMMKCTRCRNTMSGRQKNGEFLRQTFKAMNTDLHYVKKEAFYARKKSSFPLNFSFARWKWFYAAAAVIMLIPAIFLIKPWTYFEKKNVIQIITVKDDFAGTEFQYVSGISDGHQYVIQLNTIIITPPAVPENIQKP